MSDRDVSKIVQQIEHSPTTGDGHQHNFSDAYQQIVQMQNQDGGANSALFKQDMASMNQKLHADGVIPNLEIVGADPTNHTLATRDLPDGRNVTQDASSVNDFGALGGGGNGSEMALGLLAKAYGINVSKNPDGSYDVQDPFDNPQQAAAGIMSTVMNGLLGGDSDSNSDSNSRPLGMNNLEWQAWNGWDQPTDQSQDADQ